MMWWPFSKTYQVRCPDGSMKTVYKEVDCAFPLCLPGIERDISAAGELKNEAKGEIKSKYASTIHGLLFAIDELNQDLMMRFRGAYIVYQNDPCLHGQFLEREVSKLLEQQGRLRAFKVHISSLIDLVKLFPENSGTIDKAIANIVDYMGNLLLPQATSERIAESRSLAKKIAEEGNGN